MGGTHHFPRYLFFYEGLLASIECKSVKPLSWAAKGWACGVAEKGGDWLGSSTGPHTKEVWTGKYARLCSKALISHGKSDAPLQSVRIVTCYSLFWEGTANAAGKELHEVLINL